MWKLILKRKWFVLAGLIGLFLLFLAVVPLRYKRQLLNAFTVRLSNTLEEVQEPALAVFSFDPNGENKLINNSRHYKLKLSRSKTIKFDKALVSAWQKDSSLLIITVETWGSNSLSTFYNNEMKNMIDGKYDIPIKQLCDLIGNRPNVYIRFNPEIEIPSKKYPWQGYFLDYISAFGYLKKMCGKEAPQVKLVWGPSGFPGVLECYPGDEVTDAGSVILRSDTEMEFSNYPKSYSTAYDVIRRLHRLRFINKPIFVFGSKNSDNKAVNQSLVDSVVYHINTNREVAYASENFIRPEIHQDSLRKKVEIGLYDPNDLLNTDEAVTVEHLFADFLSISKGEFQKDFNNVVARNHDIIVTFEPFRLPNDSIDLQVLQHVAEGMYDEQLNGFYDIILNTSRNVYLRYAHEMEIPITRYPWQSQDPVTYIKSFRYFMTLRSPLPHNVKRVWGPAGDRGSLEWWPGNDYVDYLSMAIYGLPDKNITDPNKQESFKTIFNRKYRRFRFVDKPLFITEFGVKGPEEYQTNWLEGAAKTIRENPQIVGVNYFNMSDTPKAWGDIKPPDWSISKASFHHFLDVLNEKATTLNHEF